MFSNSAYEAFFFYVGLGIHEQLIKIITSDAFFRGLAALIFGVVFFIAVFKYFAQFTPGTYFARHSFPLSKVLKVVFVFGISVSLLKVDGSINVQDYNRASWHGNGYVGSKMSSVKPEYQVSFVFDLLMRTAQELGNYATHTVEKLFSTVHSHTKEPFFFYKAIMYASAAQIDDRTLRDTITIYIQECAEKAIVVYNQRDRSLAKKYVIDAVIGRNGPLEEVEESLSQIKLQDYQGANISCLELKRGMSRDLRSYARAKAGPLLRSVEISDASFANLSMQNVFLNQLASSAFTNHILAEKEGLLGIEKGAEVRGFWGSTFQHIGRLFVWAGISSIFDNKAGNPSQGAAEAASRANEFNALLKRAPIIRGVAMMFLTALFPILFFFIIAMKWQVLIAWFTQVLGVCLWPAVWTLIYSISTNMALSVETMQEFGQLDQGVSLIGANLISQKMYFVSSIMNYLMIGSAAAINGGLFWVQRTVMAGTREETAPEPVKTMGNTAKGAASGAVTGAIF